MIQHSTFCDINSGQMKHEMYRYLFLLNNEKIQRHLKSMDNCSIEQRRFDSRYGAGSFAYIIKIDVGKKKHFEFYRNLM